MLDAVATSLMEQDYCVLDHFLDPQHCHILLQALLGHYQGGKFKQAGIGRGHAFQHNAHVRGDEISWLEKGELDTATTSFLDHLETMIAYFNRKYYLGIRDYEAHFAVYAPGTYYHRHLDQFRGNSHRKFSFIVYLNVDWLPAHGGMLRMYLPGDKGETIVDIEPIAGRLVCFRSSVIPHEVLLTHHPRYSITGWWLDREKGLGFLP